MTFGRSIRILGEFFSSNPEIKDVKAYVRQLWESMRKMQPAPFEHKSSNVIYVPSSLFTAKKVFMRVDRVKQPLESPYKGPYEVVRRRKKFFVLRLPSGNDSVSIDCLKTAFELSENVQQEEKPTSILKSTKFDASIQVTNSKTNTGKKVIYLKEKNSQPPATVSFSQPVAQIAHSFSSHAVPPVLPSVYNKQKQNREQSYTTARGRKVVLPERYRS